METKKRKSLFGWLFAIVVVLLGSSAISHARPSATSMSIGNPRSSGALPDLARNPSSGLKMHTYSTGLPGRGQRARNTLYWSPQSVMSERETQLLAWFSLNENRYKRNGKYYFNAKEGARDMLNAALRSDFARELDRQVVRDVLAIPGVQWIYANGEKSFSVANLGPISWTSVEKRIAMIFARRCRAGVR